MMDELSVDRLWDEEVFLEDGDRTLRVQSTRDAYLLLTYYWRFELDTAHEAAIAACKAGLKDGASPDSAREAFVAAAREAGIKVNSWTD